MSEPSSLPLAGLRVADFTWLIAGPATTRMLSDLGAEVIKIETNTRDDQIRTSGIWPAEGRTATSPNAVFMDCNTNKLAITLNLNTPRGVELARELVRRSDIVANNFTGERMDRWGLGYDDLIKVKPDVIMLSMPVMGTTGPYRTYGANGRGVLAHGGLDVNMGFPGRPPVGMGPLYSDFASPYFAVSALMAALHHRERTGEGQFIDMAQFQATASLLGTDVLEYTANQRVRIADGNRNRDAAPHGAFPCLGNDRWIAIAVQDDSEWQALCEVVGDAEGARDLRFATLEARKQNEDDLEAWLASWTRRQDPWAAMELLQSRGVPAGVVEHIEDLVTRDPHMGVYHFREVTDADGGVPYLVHGQPLRLDEQPIEVTRAPNFGEHNEYVFRELLGLDDDEYVQLMVDEVIY